MIKKKIAAALIGIMGCFPVIANNVELNPAHPDTYTVVRGDTLWDISAKFLRDPWYWPEVWQVNPQIANPHLIYPGDIITLVYIDGEPRLQIQRGAGRDGALQPKVRVVDLENAIPTIPLDAISQFLSRPRVIDDESYKKAPYIVATEEERVMIGEGNIAYVRGTQASQGTGFAVFRKGRPFIDPENQEQLGYEAIYIGDARITREGDPSTVLMTRSEREGLVGDRLLSTEDRTVHTGYQPHPPASSVRGRIISVFDGVSQIGQFHVVSINRGESHGIDVGTVLAVHIEGKEVKDRVKDTDGKPETVKLPEEHAGEMIIFRTFEKMSFGLVMRATRAMSVGDIVTNPK